MDSNAYSAFQASRDLKNVVERVVQNKLKTGLVGKHDNGRNLSIEIYLMTPVLPMLVGCCVTFHLCQYEYLQFYGHVEWSLIADIGTPLLFVFLFGFVVVDKQCVLKFPVFGLLCCNVMLDIPNITHLDFSSAFKI